MAKQYLVAAASADISDVAGVDQFVIEAPYAGVLRVDECFIRWTEATGTQTTTQGRVDLLVNAVRVGSVTANVSDAIGQTQVFTPVPATDASFDFTAGQNILIEIGVQAVDRTIVGDGDVFLSLEWGVGA